MPRDFLPNNQCLSTVENITLEMCVMFSKHLLAIFMSWFCSCILTRQEHILSFLFFIHHRPEQTCPIPLTLQVIHPGVRHLVIFHKKLIFLRQEIVSPTPNPQAGRPPLVGCLQLLIQYIPSYPPYLVAVPSICNLRTCHTVVARDPPIRVAI
jgi:hypothetical protein